MHPAMTFATQLTFRDSSQIRYVCRHDVQSSKGALSVDGWSLASSRRTSRDILHYRLDIEHPTFDLEWRGLVRDYTQRKLSRPTDRILAISGIATAYQRFAESRKQSHDCTQTTQSMITLSTYVAGHWLYRLPNDLLWTVHAPQQARPTVYQGPSWSWTSVNGPVSFGHVLWDTDLLGYRTKAEHDDSMHASELHVDGSLEQPPAPHWDILEVTVDLVDDHATCGAVKNAVLTVQGLLQTFSIVSSSNCSMNPNCLNLELQYIDATKPNGITFSVKLSPDVALVGSTSPLILVPFGWSYDGQNEYILRGLALRQASGYHNDAMPRLKRCGVFQIRPNDADDEDECQEGRWRSLMPFYDGFQEKVFEII